MSIRYGQKTSSIADRRPVALAHNRDTTFNGIYTQPTKWVRPSEWLTITPPLSSEQKVVLLVGVYDNKSNLLAFRFTGNYTVDWGDGSPVENVASTVAASHEYNYASIAGSPLSDGTKQVIVTITPNASNLTAINIAVIHPFIGSTTTDNYSQYILEAYVSLPQLNTNLAGFGNTTVDTSNTINNHSLVNVELINIGSINTFASLFINAFSLRRVSIPANTSGITSTVSMFDKCYSLTEAPLFDTSNVTTMSLMFRDCFSLVYVPAYDCSKSTGLGSMFLQCRSLRRVELKNTGTCTAFGSMFQNCYTLEVAPTLDTSSGTGFTNMFDSCNNLKFVPPYDTSKATNMGSMFRLCYSLVSVPLLNTINVTNFGAMFQGCHKLTTVPLFNTSNATSTVSMFENCYSLEAVPHFNTSKVTNFTSMFYNCFSLERVPQFDFSGLGQTPPSTIITGMFRACLSLTEIPEFDTTRVTNFATTFQDCQSLKTVPLFNTLSSTNFTSMFENCFGLQSVPLFDTRNATTFAFMFFNCYSLTGVPAFDTSKVTSFASTFRICPALKFIPEFNTRNVTNFGNAFESCRGLNTVSLCASNASAVASMFAFSETLAVARLSGIGPALATSLSIENTHMSKEAIEEMFYLFGLGTGKTVLITNSYGAKRYPTLTVNGVSTTSGSVTATTSSSVSSLSTGMQITGLTVNTGPPINSPISVTFTDATDTVGLTSHGLQNGDKVSFSTITTTTGISTFTIYYVINKTDNDFQIALTPGGPAISLTNNGTGTMRYNALITEIKVGSPNTIIFDRPMTVTGTNNQSFRYLVTGDALLRNWTVTG